MPEDQPLDSQARRSHRGGRPVGAGHRPRLARDPPCGLDPDTLDVVSIDADGYGFPEHQPTLARLMEDIRVLSPAGVERGAGGWDLHVGTKGLKEFEEAEKSALRAIEQAVRGPAWEQVRR